MPNTEQIIHIVIEDETAIVKKGTISVRRGDLGHVRAFRTTRTADTVYAIEQALQELAELERRVPARSPKAKSRPGRLRLNDAPEGDESEDATAADMDETGPDPDHPTDAPAADNPDHPAELNYDLIHVSGTDSSPVAYKHAVLLAQSLLSENLWNNRTPITFDNPLEAWTQLQAGSLNLQDVMSLCTTPSTSPVPILAAPTVPSETLSVQPSLI